MKRALYIQPAAGGGDYSGGAAGARLSTAFMGKWHLGTETYYYPEHQGFDVNIAGRDYGAPGSYFFPFTGKWKIPSTGQTLHKKQPLAGKKGDYLADRLAEEAESFIRKNADKPFFLMLSHYAVHTPLQGKPEKVAKYEAVAKSQAAGQARPTPRWSRVWTIVSAA